MPLDDGAVFVRIHKVIPRLDQLRLSSGKYELASEVLLIFNIYIDIVTNFHIRGISEF